MSRLHRKSPCDHPPLWSLAGEGATLVAGLTTVAPACWLCSALPDTPRWLLSCQLVSQGQPPRDTPLFPHNMLTPHLVAHNRPAGMSFALASCRGSWQHEEAAMTVRAYRYQTRKEEHL